MTSEERADLDERMKAAGMIPLSELLSGGQPIDKWKAHTGVTNPDSFEQWLIRRYEDFMRMRVAYELGDKDKGDDLYEWVFAHSSALGEVLVNWRAMKARMATKVRAQQAAPEPCKTCHWEFQTETGCKEIGLFPPKGGQCSGYARTGKEHQP